MLFDEAFLVVHSHKSHSSCTHHTDINLYIFYRLHSKHNIFCYTLFFYMYKVLDHPNYRFPLFVVFFLFLTIFLCIQGIYHNICQSNTHHSLLQNMDNLFNIYYRYRDMYALFCTFQVKTLRFHQLYWIQAYWICYSYRYQNICHHKTFLFRQIGRVTVQV